MEKDKCFKFNINETVYVKLTAKGLDVHKKYWEEIFKYSKYEYNPPKPNSEGYYQFQLWDLMNIFGSSCYNGCKAPFETYILFSKEDVKELTE